MPKEVYLDNAAATHVDPRVIREVVRVMGEVGNPSSFNDAGRRMRNVLEDARVVVARFLNARPDEVLFFPSASAANIAATHGPLDAAPGFAHAVTTAVEHRSVLDALRGRDHTAVTVVAVNGEGRVGAGDIMAGVTRRTVVVSVMYANNEIGTIQPIKDIAKAIRAHRRRTRRPYPYFHVDASQAAGYLPMDVQAMGVDLLTFNGAKVHGPRSIAVLYARRGIRANLVEQGTDVAGAAGMGEAVRLVRSHDGARVARLRDAAIAGIMHAIPDARLNGPKGKERLANNVSISIPGVTSEELLLELDRHGIRAGSGSACTAYSVEPSHVLKAIGTPRKYLHGVVRITLSRTTRRTDVDRLLEVLPKAVSAVRRRSLK